MREEIRRLQKELGITTLYVTHDQEEAMSVSDRLAVFNLGELMQVGSPMEIYDRPNSLFVADFIGQANFFPAVSSSNDPAQSSARIAGGHEVQAGRRLPLRSDEAASLDASKDGMLMIRPTEIRLVPPGAANVPAQVERIQFLGSFTRYILSCGHAARKVLVDSKTRFAGVDEGADVGLTLDGAAATFFYRNKRNG